MKQETDKTVLERHAQTLILSIATAAILFTASFVYTAKAEIEALKLQVSTINQQITELRADIRAMQSNYVSKEEFKDHEVRIRRLEERK